MPASGVNTKILVWQLLAAIQTDPKPLSMLMRQCNPTIAVLCLPPVYHQSTAMQQLLGRITSSHHHLPPLPLACILPKTVCLYLNW
jgi:hypothetical protein